MRHRLKDRVPLPARILLRIFFAYILFVAFLAGCQGRLIYYPETEEEAPLVTLAEERGFTPVRDGDEIIGWLAKPATGSEPEAFFMVFHGNAGFALHRGYYRDALEAMAQGPISVFLFEYPGYGARSGSPSEATNTAAAREALVRFTESYDGRLYLLGESLGSGIAAHLAAQEPDRVDGLILITPFTSLTDVGAHHYPFLPVRLILRDRYNNAENLESYDGPVAILLAEEDRVVPADLGEALYDSYAGPKELWIQTGRGHNSLDLAPGNFWWREIGAFLEENQTR